MTIHHFHLRASWPGGRNSSGYIEAGQLQTEISIPQAMDGPGIGTNPDEMLLGAASTCYLITLAAMIERAKLPLNTMSLNSEGLVDVTNGIFTYQKIIHRPQVSLEATASQADFRKLDILFLSAEKNCMISKAIKNNVEVIVESKSNQASIYP